MNRKSVTLVAASLLAGCSTNAALNIRPAGTTLAQGARAVPFRIAEAQAHLALGNVALASEGFRKALRDDSASVAALVGLAHCYDRMGRFDLARNHYERALALTPADMSIYTAFASSLERSGATREAERLRSEVAARSGTARRSALAEVVALLSHDSASLLTGGAPASRPAASPQGNAWGGARLERAGLGEVVLLTGKSPHWQPLPVGPKPLPRQMALRDSGDAPVPARLTILNAAQSDGLAARTRTRLQRLGWTSVAIANAGKTLDRSELLYPAALEKDGKRLALHLSIPVRARRSDVVDRIVLRLGRDAAPNGKPT